ncbi:uncharacterized protein BJ212DRAFT_1486623 [Suillus subaureus]|uniref:Uncharacterized protein n=1 Tax=Suillus subaureus TaxID=48587 RepID=A0A9P7J652_9AGAM|nr:uncharacterized protein BJ212DRAFT_1486623 [Suillus subaureus]KAG1804498.1 hypothetical protein BJ212DRAFT_1486623 [Suillus subaureus]
MSQNVISKSTASLNSSSTFGTPISASAPLRPSSLRRLSTLTLASSCDMHVDPEGILTQLSVKKVPTQPATPRTPSTKDVKTHYSKTKLKIPAPSAISPSKTSSSLNSTRDTCLLSVSSDEEDKARSQRAKKPYPASFGINANYYITSSVHKDQARKRESRQSAFLLPKASPSSLDNDDRFSTASVETAATTVSLSTPALPVIVPKAKPLMIGPELPCPQVPPSPPLRIPLSCVSRDHIPEYAFHVTEYTCHASARYPDVSMHALPFCVWDLG